MLLLDQLNDQPYFMNLITANIIFTETYMNNNIATIPIKNGSNMEIIL
jgi:hypothetical protein